MRLKAIIFILMLSAAVHAQGQSIASIQGNPQIISGTGPDDAKALSSMTQAVGSAYSNSLDPRMAVSYSDEFRGSSHKITEGGKTCRYITRSAVEEIFSARKKQAQTIYSNAADAEKSGEPGRAAMYYYWCIALYSSLPGDNRARIEESKSRYKELSGNKFPSTAASNIISKAELIFKIIGKPSASSGVVKKDKGVVITEPSSTAINEAIDTIAKREEIPSFRESPLIKQDLVLQAYSTTVDAIKPPNMEASREAVVDQGSSHYMLRHWSGLINIGATVWQEPGIRIMGGPLYNRNYGAYIAGTWNFKKAPYSYTFGKDGALDGGGTFWSDGQKRVSDWSLTAGGIWMAGKSKAIGAYAGLGYGCRHITLRDICGNYALDTYHSVSSIIGEAGVIGRIERFTMTTGVTFSRNYLQISAGVGYIF